MCLRKNIQERADKLCDSIKWTVFFFSLSLFIYREIPLSLSLAMSHLVSSMYVRNLLSHLLLFPKVQAVCDSRYSLEHIFRCHFGNESLDDKDNVRIELKGVNPELAQVSVNMLKAENE